MVIVERVIAPPNALILILDPDVAAIPESMAGAVVSSTLSCIAVGTLSEHDGPTTLSIGDQRPVDPSAQLAWEGGLTSARRIEVADVFGVPLIEWPSELKIVREVWVNDDSEPDRVWVVAE